MRGEDWRRIVAVVGAGCPSRTRARCESPPKPPGRPYRLVPCRRCGPLAEGFPAVLSQRRASLACAAQRLGAALNFIGAALFYRGNFGRAGQRRASPRARGRACRACIAPKIPRLSFWDVRVVRIAPPRTGASEPSRGCGIVLEQRSRADVAGRGVEPLVPQVLHYG